MLHILCARSLVFGFLSRIHQHDHWAWWCSALILPQGGSTVPLESERVSERRRADEHRGWFDVMLGAAFFNVLVGWRCINESSRKRRVTPSQSHYGLPPLHVSRHSCSFVVQCIKKEKSLNAI